MSAVSSVMPIVQAPSTATIAPPSSVAYTLARQLCRHFALRSSAAPLFVAADQPARFLFAEAGSTAPAHLYAGRSLPQPSRRLSPACAVTVDATVSSANGYTLTRRTLFTLEAHADARSRAVALLDSLIDTLRPGDRPFEDTAFEAPGSFPRRGFIGAPPGQAQGVAQETWPQGATMRLARVMGVEVVSGPQETGIELSGAATAAGEGSARATIAVSHLAVDVPSPLRVFSISHGGADGSTLATVEVTHERLALRTSIDPSLAPTTLAYDFAGFATIADLIAAADGVGGWTLSPIIDDGVSSALSSPFELEYRAPIGALGPAESRSLRLWNKEIP